MSEKGIMSKEELSELLHSIGVPVSEGIASEEHSGARIVYWPFAEQDVVASGEGLKNHVTYQISLYDEVPQGVSYKKLRKALREKGQHPLFSHEYVEKDPVFSRMWHTFLAVETLEEIVEG